MISHRPISTGKKPWDLTAGDILHQPQTAAGGGGRAGVAVSGWRKTVSEPEQLLVCFDTETLRHALDLLMKHDISSLPVIGSSGTNTNSFLGFVDCLDIAG